MGQQTSSVTKASDFDPTQARLTGADGGTPIATAITYGQDDHGCDFKAFGATSGKYMLWDESADKLILYGLLDVGVDDTGYDVTFFGATASNYMRWDESVDTLLLIGTAAKFRLGTFSGSTHGSGSVLSASNTASFRVYCDDGNAAIGSGTFARAGVFRHLQVYTGGNREQEAAGVVGQIVSVAGTNRHNMCGVMGSYEARTSLTVDGQAATTDTWAQAAVIGRVGAANNILTIASNGVLAGVAAMSNVTTALAANSGVYAGFYVGKWGGATGTDSWSHGIYIEPLAVDLAIQIGVLSSTSQTGFHLTSTNNNVIDSFADDNNTTLTNAVYSNIRARTMLFKDATGISLFSVRGQIKCADEVDFGPGVFAGVQGYFETMDNTDIQDGAKVWGIDASLESPSGGTVTVDSGGILAGLHAELTGAGEFVQSSGGILAGLYIDEQVTTGKWGYGIYITAGAANKGIRIGSLSSDTPGSGMLVDATHTRAVEVHVDDNDAARATGTQGRAIFGRTMIYKDNACEDWGVDGLSKISAVAKTGNVSAGVVGRFESTGTCSTATGQGNTFVAGVMGRLGLASGFTIGAGTYACGVLSFYNTLAANDPSGEYTVAFMATASDIAGTGDWDYGVFLEDLDNGIYMRPDVMGIDSDVAVVASASYGHKFIGRTITKSDGAAGYFEGHASGTTTGAIYGLGAWLNVDSGTHAHGLYGLDVGVYADDATYTGAYVCAAAFYTHVCNDTAAPANHYMLRFNTNASEDTPDAWFHAANPQCIACTDNAEVTGSKVAAIKINVTGSNADPGYIWVYDSTGA